MTLRTSVQKAWPGFVDRFEGTLTWMYLDTKYKVTTGTGNLIDTIPAAVAAGPWYRADGRAATEEQIAAEWERVKALTGLAKQSGWAYRASAQMNLKPARVAELLTQTTARFWAELVKRWPVLDVAPADAQLAGLDLAWQNGPAFLELKTGSAWTWPNMRAAWSSGDWAKAADAVPGTGDRAEFRKRLFRNAAKVVALGADPETLWGTKTPIAPAPVLATGEEPYVAAAKVAFRGGQTCSCVAKSLPMVENYMLMKGLIQSSIDIYQLGYNGGGVAASAGTHDAGGNVDVGQCNDAQIQAWRDCGWAMQRRTRAQGFDVEHAHGWPLGCPHMSAGGREQAAQWANGTNGLASYGRIEGKYPIDNWQTAYTKRSKEIMAFKDDVAELAAKKVLDEVKPILADLPGRVWDADKIPNLGQTGNVANKTLTAANGMLENFREARTAKDNAAAAVAAIKALSGRVDLLITGLIPNSAAKK